MISPKNAPDFQSRRWNNIGRLLSLSFSLFNDRSVSKVRGRGFDDFSFVYKLVRIMNVDGTHIHLLAQRSGMTPQAMGRLVKRVESRGYVNVETDPDDARAKRVVYTKKGTNLAIAALGAINEVEAEFKKKLGAKDMAELRRILSKLIDDEPETQALYRTWHKPS